MSAEEIREYRWEDSDDESGGGDHEIIVRYDDIDDSLSVINHSARDVRLMIELPRKLVKFKVNGRSTRRFRHACDMRLVRIDGKSVRDAPIYLPLKSSAVLLNDVVVDVGSYSATTSEVTSHSPRSAHGDLKLELAKLVMMAESQNYDFKYFLSDEVGNVLSSNLF